MNTNYQLDAHQHGFLKPARYTPKLLLFFALCLALFSNQSLRADPPLSNNPDDYDVPKYQAIYDQTVGETQSAEQAFERAKRQEIQSQSQLETEQATLENIQGKIAGEEKRLTEAKAEKSPIQQSISVIQSDLEVTRSDRTKIQSAIQNERTKNDSLKANYQTADTNADQFEKSAAEKQKLLTSAMSNLESAKVNVSKAQSDLSDQLAKVTAAKESKPTLAAKVDRLQKESKTLSDRIQELKANLTQQEAKLPGLVSKVKELEQQALDAERIAKEAQQHNDPNFPELKKKAEDARAQAKSALAELATARSDLAQVRSTIEEQKKLLPAQEAKVSDLESQFKDLDAKAIEAERLAKEAQQNHDPKFHELKKAADEARAAARSKRQELESGRKELVQIRSKIEEQKKLLPAQEIRVTELTTKAKDLDTQAMEAERQAKEAQHPADPNYPALKKRAEDARALVRSTQAELDQERKVLSQIQGTIKDTESSHDSKQAALRDAQTELANVDTKIKTLESQIPGLEQARNDATTQLTAARNRFDTVNTESQSADQKAMAARAEANKLQGLLSQSTASLNEFIRQDQLLSERIADLNGKLQDRQKQIRQLDAEISFLESDIPQQRQMAAQQAQKVDAARRTLVRSHDDVVRSHAILADRRQSEDRAETKLKLVTDNVRRYQVVARQDGHQDGTHDGTDEGTRQGRNFGQRDGLAEGQAKGSQDGRQEGIRVARQQGADLGSKDGNAAGSKAGTKDGQFTGAEEGKNKGKAEGLIAGFEAGKKAGFDAGYPQGIEQGHKLGGYQAGFSKGSEAGKLRAKTTAEPIGLKDGYEKTEQAFLETDLKEVDISSSANESNIFGYPDWQNYHPSRHYPHPLIQTVYEQSYHDSFLQSAADAYDRNYNSTFTIYYQDEYAKYYQIFVNKPYETEYQDAYSKAYESNQQSSYKKSYQTAYSGSYDSAYTKFYNDNYPVRIEEGRKVGLASGIASGKNDAYQSDFADGEAKGEPDGFDKSYQGYYDAAFAKGQKDAKNYYSTHAVFEFESASLIDQNDDGIFAPGELVSVILVVKNYGLVPQKTPLRAGLLSFNSDSLKVLAGSSDINPIQGQSRTTIRGVGRLQIAPQLKMGGDLGLSVSLSFEGKALGSTNLTFTPTYPYMISNVEIPEILYEDTPNRIGFQVDNLSSKASSSDVTVTIKSSEGLSYVETAPILFGKIDGASALQSEFYFTYPKENAYKQMGFELTVHENAVKLGSLKISLDTARRWVYNETSRGLIVVNGDKMGRFVTEAQRNKIASNFDFYDIQVEGELNIAVINNYWQNKKAILVPDSKSLDFDHQYSTDTLKKFLSWGGSIYVNDSLGLSSEMRKITDQYSVHSKIEFPNWSVHRPKSWDKPNSPFDEGNLYTLIVDHGALGDALSFSKTMHKVDWFTLPLSRKLEKIKQTSAADKDELALGNSLILNDLSKEMNDDKEIDGDLYKKRPDSTLLKMYVNETLASTAKNRTNLLSIYPQLEDAKKNIGGIFSSRATAIGKILKPVKKAFKKEMK